MLNGECGIGAGPGRTCSLQSNIFNSTFSIQHSTFRLSPPWELQMSNLRKPRARALAALCALAIAPVALFFLLDLAVPFPAAKLRRAPAVVVFDRNGDALRVILPPDQKLRIPVTLDEVPPGAIKAILTSEDRWFWRHPGVNPVAIVRAVLANLHARRRVSGASTIPMQIARMAEPK